MGVVARVSSLPGLTRELLLYALNKYQKPEEKMSIGLKSEVSSRSEPIVVEITLPHSSCGNGYDRGESLSKELRDKFGVDRVKISGSIFLAALTPEQLVFVSKKRWIRQIHLAKDALPFHEDRIRQDCIQRGELDKLDERLRVLRETYTI